MATADLLLELMFSWIEQREDCAEQLKKLAQELESLREKCNGSECVGSSVAVVGAACLVGAGLVTLTAGAAAPFLGALGAAYSGVGVAISVTTKITEHFSSSNTMKEAQEIEQKSKEIAEKIQKLFEQLKEERREVSSFADPDELDQHVMTEILRAMTRRSGQKWEIDVHMLDNELQFYCDGGPGHMRLNQNLFSPEVKIGLTIGLIYILRSFAFQVGGKKGKTLFAVGAELLSQLSIAGAKQAKNLMKLVSSTGFKTALKGGAMVAGGAVGLVFELPEAIDNWKEMIEKNHVTEASKSLKDAADAILETCRTLRQQFTDIEKMFEEMAKSQREHEERLSNIQQEEEESDQEEEEIFSEWEESDQEEEEIDSEGEERDQEEEEIDSEGEESDQEEEEIDSEGEERDQEEEEIDSEGEESDQEEEEIDSEGEESDQEEEESDSEGEESDQEEEETDSEGEESDQEEEETDSEGEESDQEEEESESEEETERDRKKIKRHQKKRTQGKERGKTEEEINQGQDSSFVQEQSDNLRTTQRPPAAVRFGLLNVRSMNNKPEDIRELIVRENLDIFLPTETWSRRNTADEVHREASPENFDFCFQARDGRGGGVSILFLEELQGEQIHLDFITTFEYVIKVLQHDEWDEPIVIINLYLPPGCNKNQFRKFLDEFEMLLKVLEKYPNLIVCGDFNIKVDPEKRSFRDEFYHILPLYDLVQHVREPTHNRGNTLDLVITRNVEIFDLLVQDDGISDHFTVYFTSRPVSEDARKKTKESGEQDEQVKRFKKKEE